MYQEIIRPMNECERAILTQHASHTKLPASFLQTAKWIAVWTMGMIVAVVGGLIILDLELNPAISGLLIMPLMAAGFLCLFLTITAVEGYFQESRRQKTFVSQTIPQILQAIADGKVSIKKVSAKAVIVLQEFEDEGTGYLFDIGSNRSLFLKGQCYSPHDQQMDWPNSQFEVVRTVNNNLWIGIFCNGEELTPIRVIDMAAVKEDIAWDEREEIIEQDFEDFANSILTAS